MRKKKLAYNTVAAIINQLATLICGFILPRQILLYFGSEVNGLVSSITQFLGFVTLLDMGVGAVVQSALYRPLAKNDADNISRIMISAKKFFNRIGTILLFYTLVLMFFYPLFIDNGLGYISTAFLVLSISISSISQYYFGVVNQILLNADQKSYVQLLAQSTVTILNTVFSVVLIRMGASITIVKFVASLILLLRPVFLSVYVNGKYEIDYSIKLVSEPIPQKWNAMYQHVATFIVDKTDIVVLTLLTSLSEVSIYYVYHLVVSGLYQAFFVMTTGIQSLLGDMYAKKEYEKLNYTYNLLEWVVHTTVVFLFSCAGVLIVPFVQVYTKGIQDANYFQPTFSVILTLAYAFCCLRGFYNLLIKAVGHYKETQNSAMIEALLNILISVILVWQFGLVGVAIGTLVAMAYRTLYFIHYISKNIIGTPIINVVKQFTIDIVTSVSIVMLTYNFTIEELNYRSWIMLALKDCFLALAIVVILNIIFYRSNIKNLITRYPIR